MRNYELVIHPAEEGVRGRRVDLLGTLDSHTVTVFEKTMGELLNDDSIERIQLHLEGLTFISSAGISALMAATVRLRQRGGELVLVRPSEKVHRVFKTLGFTNLFKIVEKDAELERA